MSQPEENDGDYGQEPDNRQSELDQREIELEVERAMARLRGEQNILGAVAGGIGGALAGAILWAVITVTTGYVIGFMAVGVGFLTGASTRYLGKGIDKTYGVIGAILALAGCLLGNLLMICGLISQQEKVGFFEVILSLTPDVVMQLMIATFSPMDLVFYGLAIFQGYRMSFRNVTEDDLLES